MNLAETLWNRVIAGFSQAAVPVVPVSELLLVIAAAIALSIPAVTWKYFGLVSTVVHELGHAFAALTSGQRLGGIRLKLDHSGTTTSFSRGRFPAIWSGFWGYPVPALVGAALVWAGFNGWGPASMSLGVVILVASLLFIRNAMGLLIMAVAVLLTCALILYVPAEFNSHLVIVVGLALLVASVRDLGKLCHVHLKRRERLGSSDAYLLYRATAVPSAVWITLFAVVVAIAWLIAWQPISGAFATAGFRVVP
jgi:hypothetical protein